MECPDCGTLTLEDDLFCGECGAILAPPPLEEPALEPLTDSPLAPGVEPGGDWAAERVVEPPTLGSPAAARTIRDSRANAAYILGIISIALVAAYCFPFGGVLSCIQPVVGLSAIILGAMAKRDIKARGGQEADQKRAHQGMILGIVSTAIYLVLIAVALVLGVGGSILD
jgi:hypothetical protein